MKHYYRISWNIENTPLHLAFSVVLSFLLMLFMNGFIGSMGGISAFVAFGVVFYVQRGMLLKGNHMSHQLAMDSKKELRFMMVSYAVGYMALWAIMKLVIFFSRISGWGNIDGLTMGEYLTRIYGSTMFERWAYFFVGILMFALVMSLFPLVVIRKPKAWISYLIADGLFFAVVCGVIELICRIFIDERLLERTGCVLDDLLLCQLLHPWQPVVYILGIVLLTIIVIEVSYIVAKKFYLPKPGIIEFDEKRFLVATEQERASMKRLRMKRLAKNIVIGVVSLGVCIFFVGNLLFGKRNEHPHYHKIAECLTKDSAFGPMQYGSIVYLPVDEELNYYETGEALGYLGYKDENCESRFYELAVANVLYKGPNWEETYLQMYGADENTFEEATKIESKESWRTDSVFLLWDEEWEDQIRYTNDITGYSICEKDYVLMLENEFGVVTYNPKDFTEYDAYFTIRGYHNMQEAFRQEGVHGDWVGCILVKDDKFYYGNYQNEIKGNMLEDLLEILGGYKK